MSRKTGGYPIPFDKDGNQMDFPEKRWKNGNPIYPDMRDNFEFEDTLALKQYGRGRSSVSFILSRTNGKTVSVFVSDFFDMAASEKFAAGKITGRFTFTKRGMNYGCRLIEDRP